MEKVIDSKQNHISQLHQLEHCQQLELLQLKEKNCQAEADFLYQEEKNQELAWKYSEMHDKVE